MGHYAQVRNGIVERVIVADQGFVDSLPDDGSKWIQTSYWTRAGVHYQPTGEPSLDQSKALRKNFAGIDFVYDEENDAFIPPCPGTGWKLDPNTFTWYQAEDIIMEETEE